MIQRPPYITTQYDRPSAYRKINFSFDIDICLLLLLYFRASLPMDVLGEEAAL